MPSSRAAHTRGVSTLAQRGHRPSPFTVGSTFQHRWHLSPAAFSTVAWIAWPTVTSTWGDDEQVGQVRLVHLRQEGVLGRDGEDNLGLQALADLLPARAVSRAPLTTSRPG